MKNALISVIIPIYNCEKYIDKCISSIINQTYKNIEILLINDESTDKTLEVCRKYAKLPYVYLYSKKHAGVSSARNYGIKKAKGDYLLFIDSDDYIDNNCIELLRSKYEPNTLFCLNYCKTILSKEKVTQYTEYEKSNFIKRILNGKNHGGICGILFKKEKIKNLHFDNNTFFMEDTIFLIEYLKNIQKIKFLKDNCYYHYVENNTSITKSKDMCITKIKNICYSLSKIDKLLDFQYHDDIENKLAILLEKEMRNCHTNKEIKTVFNLIPKLKYKGNSKRVTLFSNLFNLKKCFLLKTYYHVRNIIKNLFYIIECRRK